MLGLNQARFHVLNEKTIAKTKSSNQMYLHRVEKIEKHLYLQGQRPKVDWVLGTLDVVVDGCCMLAASVQQVWAETTAESSRKLSVQRWSLGEIEIAATQPCLPTTGMPVEGKRTKSKCD